MSKNIWVISDTHFNHENILKFKDKNDQLIRPFSDVHDMNETMIDRWNKLIKPEDKVYHLGDVYFGNEQKVMEILKRLNGHKRLILGNHDQGNSKALLNNFEKINMWRMFTEFGLLLTHVPVHPTTIQEKRFVGFGKDKQMVNVHGHTHNNGSPEGPYKCVCVELTDYMPVHIDQLRVC